MPLPLVVGVGASAGGVEALRRFFSAVPLNSGLAFVVCLHFPPHGTSHLVGILSQCTALPVTAAIHGETIQSDRVYVVPPGAVATFAEGRIDLRQSERAHNPIDAMFCSLAEGFGVRALGVVLSGTGSDGARGIEAISAHGGFSMAQVDGGSTAHPEMPANAIATGLVDHVARVEDIPARLAAYGESFATGAFGHAEFAPHRLKGVKDELCELLLKAARHDFSRYKASTFLRRVGRRMRVLRIPDWGDYVDYARQTPDEVLLLFRDLLIGVTAFFRDEAAFETLATRFIPLLFEGKGPQDRVRVWVAGCSTGEEAYSIAILLCEYAHTLPDPPQIQVFATDVDEEALRFARAGRYPAAALAGVRDDRVRQFFARDENAFVCSKDLRAVCTFALHSIIRDPPLCNIDLVSCRNVLIYFDRRLQDQVIPTLHFALRPGGILFLGPSENIGQYTELFSPLDKAGRIFERLGSARRSIPFLPASRGKAAPLNDLSSKRKVVAERTIAQAVEAQIAKLYGPANVVVNVRGDIVHFSPRTGKYLEPIPGGPSQNLLSMARKELRISLRGALHEARKTARAAVRDDVAVALDPGVVQRVRVVVQPLEQEDEGPLWLVTFHDIGSVALVTEVGPMDPSATGADMAIQQLERELLETRESLQSAVDEYEIAVEELRSSNEELMSMNDDLQASNEELEASKEELHVVNDELRTVNGEFAGTIDELKQANGDLRNLFESTNIAVVFLDKDLVIRSFTPSVTEVFRLTPGDCGRRLTDIVGFLDYDTLAADIATVLETREPVERPVTRRDRGVHYLLRVIPYLSAEGGIDGVLVTLVNVTVAVEGQAQERYHRLLIAELNHRVKNILSVVSSLAMQSLRGTTTPDEFAKVFLGRLQALAKAQQLLADENWAAVPVRALIASGLEVQTEDAGRVTLDGPPIRIETKAATTLSLAIHELATNATKYGAFANDTGHVTVTWAQEMQPGGAVLVIRWRESGGPPVHPPKKQGFGMVMIERGIKYEVHGQAKVEFLPAGVEAQISIPLDRQNHSTSMRADGQSQ
ncbi:MAG: PAS domain-containing protein [Alphaproteobacteria bacterium]|nr:PAS domain-containing protein [Alphaproteobacteria bacterium]